MSKHVSYEEALIEFLSSIYVMETLVDDIGSFPLPLGVKREDFSSAYQRAREAIFQGKDITKDDFLQRNFCSIVLDSFRKKVASGLDIVNFPQQYDGIKQVGDVIHLAMENGSFVVDQDKAVFPEVHLINQQAKTLSEEFGKKIQLRVSVFGPLEQYLHEVGKTAYPDVLDGFARPLGVLQKTRS